MTHREFQVWSGTVVNMEEKVGSTVVPVTIRQMFTMKTTIEGNRRNFFKWFFGLAVPCDAFLYLSNIATNARFYHSTTGIYLESVVTFGIFVMALIVAQRKSARLIRPDAVRP
jgi:hypothetical protein